MRKTFWVTGLAICGFFVIFGLLYVISDKGDPETGLNASHPDRVEATPEEGDSTAGGDEVPTAEEQDSEDAQANSDNAQEDVDDQQPERVLLQNGDEGPSVRELQQQLNELGYDLGEDGVYGHNTQWMVKDLQNQTGVTGDGTYTAATQSALERVLQGEATVEPGKGIHLNPENGVVTNPDDLLVCANKIRKLPESFAPDDLIRPDVPVVFDGDLPQNKLRRAAAEALEQLFAEAEAAGHELLARSGYRSYATQQTVFSNNVKSRGEEEANQVSARPGESEHQTGLSMDITSESANFQLLTRFGETEEGKWVASHAADFGFILRYPEGKEEITGYQYEPWHLRYVGKEAAEVIATEHLTLEQYLLQN